MRIPQDYISLDLQKSLLTLWMCFSVSCQIKNLTFSKHENHEIKVSDFVTLRTSTVSNTSLDLTKTQTSKDTELFPDVNF